ncbi:hypothetical protein [Faecalibacillus intestinalis]|uniref:hypothetical protein n=1 Tax=Faecalibacillus intestinalis TaxID=1982626 RepID=UPI0035224073
MATSSITHNFVISGQRQVNKFVEAIEESANNPSIHTPINAKEIKGENALRNFMKQRRKMDVG